MAAFQILCCSWCSRSFSSLFSFLSDETNKQKKPVPYQQIFTKFLCLHMEDHTAIEAFLVSFFYRASLIMSKEYNKYHRQYGSKAISLN